MATPIIKCKHVADCSEPPEFMLTVETVQGEITLRGISLCCTCWNAIKAQATQDIIDEAVKGGMRYSMQWMQWSKLGEHDAKD